jgi:hypothetical protein
MVRSWLANSEETFVADLAESTRIQMGRKNLLISKSKNPAYHEGKPGKVNGRSYFEEVIGADGLLAGAESGQQEAASAAVAAARARNFTIFIFWFVCWLLNIWTLQPD